MNVQTCEFVSATDLVPKGWGEWFWASICEDAPFTWGNNNRSMVTAECFANHCEEVLLLSGCCGTSPCAVRQWLKKVRKFGQMYIDLES